MAKLVPAQIEQLQQIGAYLRQVRQDQGKAVDDIANQIFIRPALLRAIEEGRDDLLPEPVFVQGFIRRYAEALGIDGSELSQKFSVTAVAVLPDPRVAESSSVDGVVEPETRHGIKVLSRADASPAPRRPQGQGFPTKWVVGAGAIAIAVGLGIWGLLTLGKNRPTPNLASTPEPAQLAAPNDDPAAGDVPEVAITDDSTSTSSATPLEAPVVLGIDLVDRSWLSVTVDGSKVYEGVMEGGAQETWTAEDSIILTSGNAGGVEVAFNGNDPVLLGQTGDVKTITFTPDTDPATITEP